MKTEEKLDAVYHYFKDKSLGEFETFSKEKKLDPEQQSYLHALHELANQTNEEEFTSIFSSDDIPAVRLSNDAMNTLRGGFIPAWVLIDIILDYIDEEVRRAEDPCGGTGYYA